MTEEMVNETMENLKNMLLGDMDILVPVIAVVIVVWIGFRAFFNWLRELTHKKKK